MNTNIEIKLTDFYNDHTLNIFSDASMGKYNGKGIGCYGVAAVTKDNIIETCYRIVSEATSNESEIKGVRKAISLANKYKNNFKNINIFCDSLYSIYGLINYIYKWKYNPDDHMLYTSSGQVAANQSVFIEAHQMLMDLCSSPVSIHIYHQSGHVDSSFKNIKEATDSFCKFNNFWGKVDYNFIRYISTYNNYVDNTSRSYLRSSDFAPYRMDPVEFYATGKIKKFLQ